MRVYGVRIVVFHCFVRVIRTIGSLLSIGVRFFSNTARMRSDVFDADRALYACIRATLGS